MNSGLTVRNAIIFSEAYIRQDGRIPFKMDTPVRGEAEFTERMEYLADAIKKMINDVNTQRETQRLQHMNIREGPIG